VKLYSSGAGCADQLLSDNTTQRSPITVLFFEAFSIGA
jgi:hypothetical protein